VVPRRSTTGARMAFLQLEDMTGTCEVVVFARTFEECAALLRPDAVVVVRGRVESPRGSESLVGAAAAEEDEVVEAQPAKLIAELVMSLDDPRLLTWRADQTVYVTVRHTQAGLAGSLRRCLDEHGGEIPVIVHVEHRGKVDEVTLGPENGVSPSPALERAVAALLGEGSYRVELRRERAPVSPWRRNGAPSGAVTAARRG
jgi:DNA polymerase-3 subunit alpha